MEYKNNIIAVDFDGTLCEYRWPEIGEPNENLITYLKERQKNGDKIILWTCRVSDMLKDAVEWASNHGLIFDAVNENLPEIVEAFGSDTRKVFANEYIDDRSTPISSCRPKSAMQLWAEKEIEIACQHERSDSGVEDDKWDYGCACYESALRAFRSLLEDGHSGFSIGITKHILNRLIDGNPITPIVDTEDVWRDVSDMSSGYVNYQCKRMSSLFKYVHSDGSIKYRDVDRYCAIAVNNSSVSYHSGLVDRIMDELYPIQMPYFPGKRFDVFCEEFLTDRKNGDFDTVGILYAIEPLGKRIEINRYFKESEDDFVEIVKSEYEERRQMHLKREETEASNEHKNEGCICGAAESCYDCGAYGSCGNLKDEN